MRTNIAFGGAFLLLGLAVAVRALLLGGLSPTAGFFFGALLTAVGALRLWVGLRGSRA